MRHLSPTAFFRFVEFFSGTERTCTVTGHELPGAETGEGNIPPGHIFRCGTLRYDGDLRKRSLLKKEKFDSLKRS